MISAPAFYHGFAHKRNPPTLAGVDAAGRLLPMTADGHCTDSDRWARAPGAALGVSTLGRPSSGFGFP